MFRNPKGNADTSGELGLKKIYISKLMPITTMRGVTKTRRRPVVLHRTVYYKIM